MAMSAVSGSDRSQAGAGKPQPRTRADFAAAFAAAQGAQASPVRSPLLAAKLILPTRQNVQQLASMLGQKLTARLSAAGIAKTPTISFAVDGAGGIQISGARGDLAAIDGIVSSDAGLQRLIRATGAIASHACDIENGGALQFQRAYRLSSDPQEIVAQYASLFSRTPRAPAASIAFFNGAVSVMADGQTSVIG